MHRTPYIEWSRTELADHLMRQVNRYNLDDRIADKVIKAAHDSAWEPNREFNGCNVIQDQSHPCVACFLHDYDWQVNGGGKKYDVDFRCNLIATGHHPAKAWAMYVAVRIGWMFYYKWVK